MMSKIKNYKNNYKNNLENIILNIKYRECRSVKMHFFVNFIKN